MASKIKERGILFKGHLVKAIMEGRKGHTRRVVKTSILAHSGIAFKELDPKGAAIFVGMISGTDYTFRCPYGVPGDRIWVRESWADGCDAQGNGAVAYKADSSAKYYLCDNDGEGDPVELSGECNSFFWMKSPDETKWKPSIHMPRWASRITLEITEVRVERIQDISDADVVSEGIEQQYIDKNRKWFHKDDVHALAFAETWDVINEKRGFGWAMNPWVWVLSFNMIKE